MKAFQRALILVLGLVFLPTPEILAFNNPGHMSVAGLAFDELTPAQQKILANTLRKHPDIGTVIEGFPSAPPTDRELVMACATWPDLIKRKHTFTDNGYEAQAAPPTSVKFDHLMHKGWHFIDTPIWVGDGAAASLPDVPKVNAVGIINVLTAQLKSNESDEAKAHDIVWLLHLVGDLHQPLHAVTGVSATNPKGDTGGNTVALEGVTHGERELHALWDDILGKTTPADKHTHLPRLDKDVITAKKIILDIKSVALDPDAESVDPSVWASESLQMAEQDVYNLNWKVVSGEHGDELHAILDSSYPQMTLRDIRIRVRVAGHRLALLLKQVLN
jgi:hypothetical protein